MEERSSTVPKITGKVKTKSTALGFSTKGPLSVLVGVEGRLRNEWEVRKSK